MGIAWIGPVALTLYDPQLSWSAEVVSGTLARGLRGATITGETTWQAVHQLSELVDNPERRITVSTHSGILEYIYTDDVFLAPYRGWYLLEAINLRADQKHSILGVGTTDGLVGLDLKAAYIGDRQVVVARSARARTTDFPVGARALIAYPFYGENATGGVYEVDPAGGSRFSREYDASWPHTTATLSPPAAADRQVTLFSAPVGAADQLPPLAVPVLETPDDRLPGWITARGGDVRAYDRRSGREAYGPTHPVQVSTDLIITNGLIRIWVGPRLLTPYLQIEAFSAGAWWEEGNLALAGYPDGNVLEGVRLTSLTPERATMVVAVRNVGDVTVTLRRGERMLRIRHGSPRTPSVAAPRAVAWYGMPPYRELLGVTSAPAKFGNGVQVAAGGRILFNWPPAESTADWSVAGWWLPGAAVGTQGDSGVLSLLTSTGAQAGAVTYSGAAKTLSWVQGATTITSPVLAFNAGDPIFFCIRFSTVTGRTLTVKTPAGAVTHTLNASATDPGTTEATFDTLCVSAVGATPGTVTFGGNTFGTGPFGGTALSGGTNLNGTLDNVMIFVDYLTDAEAAALSVAVNALDGLPVPESRLIWYAPFDTGVSPAGSPLTAGVEYEATADGGTTRVTDSYGFTKELIAVRSNVAKSTGLAFGATAVSVDVAAALATTGSGDNVADHQAQFAAHSEQELRVR